MDEIKAEQQLPRKEFENACGHSLSLIDQNREYLQMRLAAMEDKRAMEALDDIEVEAARLNRTIAELMQLLELTDNEPQRNCWFDLCRILRVVEQMQDDIFRQMNVKLKLELSGVDSCWLRADPEQAERICFHLLSNALRACAPDGKIVFRLEQKENCCKLTVSDNGCGLATPERWQENHRRFLGGAKAGLQLCSAYCQRFGWTLSLNDRPRGGAQAEVLIPLPTEKPELAAEVELNSTGSERAAHLCWLIRRELRIL